MTREILFLIQREKERVKEFVMKAARKAEGKHIKAEALEKKDNNPHIHYGLNGNRIFHRINVRRCGIFPFDISDVLIY